MDADDGDTLARSQLALLYKLGLLQQDAGEVENDPHAFLNRLPPPAASEIARKNASFQSSGEGAWKDTSARSPYAAVGHYEPVIRIRTRALPSPVHSVGAVRVPLSPRPVSPPAGRSTSRFSFANSSRLPEEPPCVVTQRWFGVWKCHVEAKEKLVQADTKRRHNIKRRVLHEWTAAVYRRRLLDARCRQLRCWKAKRALHMWARYTALHGRVTSFLSTRGRSSALMNRLRRARGFERWRVFAQWSGRQRCLQAKAQAASRCAVLRKLWLAWRVDVFQARRRRGIYRRFMDTIQSEMVERQSRWELAAERYARHASERLARLLRRWRLFNGARQRDHLCAWRVRNLLRRGRYFAIWVDALRDKGRIEPLRLRIQRRVERSFLWAWHATARAIVLSRSSTLWHPQAICTRYLTVWKRWSYDARRFSHATMVLRAKRQRRALRIMRAWTVAHGKFSRLCSKADAIARRRILRHVWENGWLVLHWQRQLDRTRSRQLRRMTQTRVFGLWRLAWSIRFEWRDKKQVARRMAFKAAVQSVWTAWQGHAARRLLHRRNMTAASRHHRHQLYVIGLVAFAKRVDTKSVYTTAARRIRLEQRRRLIRRVFCAWRSHIQRKGSLKLRLHQYLTRPAYAHSLWNPIRRRWRRWQEFMHLRKRLLRLRMRHRTASTRLVFHAWRRRAVLRSLSRVQRGYHQNRRCTAAFSAWASQVHERRWKGELNTRARDFHRGVIGVKALRAWRAVACGRLRRLRRQYEQVRSRYRQQVTRWALRRWHAKLRQRLAIHGLESRRRLVWLQCCWFAWSHCHAQLAKRKRKLRYYRQIYGLYPACSPLRRQWSRWKSQALLGAAASKLRRRCGWRGVRDCFSAWKTFRTAKLALREWHTLSVIAGATNNDLGKRLRLFRLQCWRRQIQRMLSAWAQFCHCRQREQMRLEMTHRRMLRDVPHAEAKRRKRRRCLLRLWFQRWRRRQLASLYTAEQWHRQRHCRHILHAWWQQVIHSKQERLLQDARHTVEMMSAHRMAQQTRRVASDSRQYASDGIKAVPAVRSRATSTPAKRPPPPVKRMVDPDEYASTYRQQQQRGRPLSQSRKDITPCRRETSSGRTTPVQRHSEPVRESEELLGRVTTPIRERHRVASVGVQELPLFDEEPHDQAPVNCDHTDLLPRRSNLPPAQIEGGNDGDPLLSLELIATMDPYSPAKQPSRSPQHLPETSRSTAPPLRRTVAPPQRFPESDAAVRCSQTPRRSEPTHYTPSQSLRPRASAGGMRALTKVPEKRVAAKQELVEILEISPQRPAQSQVSTFRTVLHGMQAESSGSREEINVDTVVRVVIKYYVLAAQRFAASGPLERWGFCMLRDLGLFVTGYFLEDMEKAIKRVPADDLGQMLRNLLCEFIRNHPHYAPHNASQIESAERQLDPLGWLVKSHLPPRLGHATMMVMATDPAAQPVWIRHELPQEVVLSLPKLLRCMNKYQKPLETFFAWRPERSASGSSASRRRSMDAASFLSLMKHCNVYPQLFDRRELEDAVACAGASHHGGGGQLDMPQFVEALVRCALRLKWADEASDSSSAELVVVVKFLMLIFAMEGQGSMLTKRSQDLDAVLRFLQRQQDTTTKSAKLRQFQALLRAESSSKSRIPKHTSNVFRAAMANPARTWQGSGVQGSLNTVRPAHRSARSPHQMESPESSVTRGQDLRRMRLTASSTVPFHDCVASNDVEKDSDERQIPWSHELEHHGSAFLLNPVNSSLATEHDTRGRTPDDDRRTCEAANEPESPVLDSSAQRTESITLPLSPTIVSGPTHLENDGLRAPMDRDAFLNDILSSLHDVELLLQHSDIRRPSKNATSPAELDVELKSEPFSAAYPERYAVLTTGQLSSGINGSDNSESSLPTDDISIRDPLLDHLTFADRFSESPDWQSHLSIADLAVHGIHAAFPSATHVRTSVQTGELDDLTDPQRTAAYLRAENYAGLHENWLC